MDNISDNLMGFPDRTEHLEPHTKAAYIIHTLLVLVIAGLIWVFYIRKLTNEFRSEFMDVFQVLQLIFTLMFAVTRAIFALLGIINGFEYYYVQALALNTYFFYFYEIINNAGWLTFILHLYEMKNMSDLSNLAQKRIVTKEACIIAALVGFLFPGFFILVTGVIIGLAQHCQQYRIFDDQFNFNKGSFGDIGYRTSVFVNSIMFYICVFVVIGKFIIGYVMLRIMKKTLRYPYDKIYKSVWFTMIMTLVVIALNYVANFIPNKNSSVNSFSIFWIYAITRWEVGRGTIVWRGIISIINYLLEVSIMVLNTEAIDFRYYISMMMYGRMQTEKLPETSLFLVYRPYYEITDYLSVTKSLISDSNSSSVLDRDEELENETFKKMIENKSVINDGNTTNEESKSGNKYVKYSSD